MSETVVADGGVVVESGDGVLRIAIRRPAKRNALTIAMYEAMTAALREADRTPSIRVVLLHGEPTVFTAGNDLADFLERPATDPDHPAFRFVETIASTATPIVAAVNGACVGVGCTMLLHCDLVYAGERATFALPFVNLGLCPEAGSSLLLPMAAGHARAAELLLLGEPFGASAARDAGIVSAVLPDADVLGHAERQAAKLAAKPPAALRLAKSLLRRGSKEAVDAAIREESARFRERLQSPEAKEAFAAFLDKRKPDFSRFG